MHLALAIALSLASPGDDPQAPKTGEQEEKKKRDEPWGLGVQARGRFADRLIRDPLGQPLASEILASMFRTTKTPRHQAKRIQLAIPGSLQAAPRKSSWCLGALVVKSMLANPPGRTQRCPRAAWIRRTIDPRSSAESLAPPRATTRWSIPSPWWTTRTASA